jgi:hypothetical protein
MRVGSRSDQLVAKMTTETETFIANLQFATWRRRFYLRARSEEVGEAAFRKVMGEIESIIGPNAKSQSEFVREARQALLAHGFQEVRR